MAHEHGPDHEHEDITFLMTEVTDGAIAQIRESHAGLADLLDIT